MLVKPLSTPISHYAVRCGNNSGRKLRVMTELEHRAIRDTLPTHKLGFVEDPVAFRDNVSFS